MRASMLFTTTAQPTVLVEAGTSYSHIVVSIGNNFTELEINNVVELIFPLAVSPPNLSRDGDGGGRGGTFDIRPITLQHYYQLNGSIVRPSSAEPRNEDIRHYMAQNNDIQASQTRRSIVLRVGDMPASFTIAPQSLRMLSSSQLNCTRNSNVNLHFHVVKRG